ncbi:MAG TPA: hypothetical protein VJR94_06120 [Candidatus Nitrosocosmicus sp.]|nr:hypothetical protein [Candidatus Nitrosocosmicus sp.]
MTLLRSRNIVQLHKHFDSIISRNASRLDELINNLSDVARIELSRTHGLQLQKEKLDLDREINEYLKT